MKPTDRIKRAAFEKALDYFLADPEPNAVKIMDLLDKRRTRLSRRPS